MVDREKVKKEIRDAALQVFLEYGYQKATMRKIAKACGMPLATMQYYYNKKMEIFLDISTPAKSSTILFMKKLSDPVIINGEIDDNYIEELTSILETHLKTYHKIIYLNIRQSHGTPFENRYEELVSETKKVILVILKKISDNQVIISNYIEKYIGIVAQMVIDLVVAVAQNYEDEEWVHDILKEGILNNYKTLLKLAKS